VSAARPHVVLLDLKLTAGPQTDGLDVCRRLCATHPGLEVLVLTTFAEDRLVVESVQAGARGYVVKDVDTTELVRAIRAVSRGERVRRAQRVGDGAVAVGRGARA
jgi:DNA-binding NarL/FixJ family response regulator